MVRFRWNTWNVTHISAHDVHPADAEWIVRHMKPPYPQAQGDGKFLVRGQTQDGHYIQVIFTIDPAGREVEVVDIIEVGEDETLYVIHARPLTDKEKRSLRRRRR